MLTGLQTEDSGKLGCKLVGPQSERFESMRDFAVTGKTIIYCIDCLQVAFWWLVQQLPEHTVHKMYFMAVTKIMSSVCSICSHRLELYCDRQALTKMELSICHIHRCNNIYYI